MATHVLKTWPEYFQAVKSGIKKFEIRKSTDRDFKVGDDLDLEEWDPVTEQYTGEKFIVRITYIFEGGSFGLAEGYVVMSIE